LSVYPYGSNLKRAWLNPSNDRAAYHISAAA
jgi:hypothetical protein